MVLIETYQDGIEDDLWQIFYTAIHQVCARDYSRAELDAWAPEDFDRRIFVRKMQTLKPYFATIGNAIVGYADLQYDGYIDHFFVHGEHQRKGVGNALMERILQDGRDLPRLYSNVSNTAKPFFKRYGFNAVKKQCIEMRGQHLENNAMELIQAV